MTDAESNSHPELNPVANTLINQPSPNLGNDVVSSNNSSGGGLGSVTLLLAAIFGLRRRMQRKFK